MRWWIPQASKIIRQLRKKCLNCQTIDNKCFQTDQAGLPIFRTQGQQPFEVIGIDFAGPLNIPQPCKFMAKSPSICIITCPYTRAVSLHATHGQTAHDFHLAYDEFRCTRAAQPKLIISDRGRSFIAGQKNIEIFESIFPTAWEFNPPRTAWWGGFYERLIGMIKNKLARTFGRQHFETFEDFRVAVKFIEAAVNNRPVWSTKGPRGEYYTITPSQFINPGDTANFNQMVSNAVAPLICDSITLKDAALIIYKQHSYFAKLHQIFQREYINALRTWHNTKIFTTKESRAKLVQVGDIVLIKPPSEMKKNSPWARTQWKIGRITKTYQTLRDGAIRKVDVDVLDKNGQVSETRNEYTLQHFAPIEHSPSYDQLLQRLYKTAKIPNNV
jgi:hypothetical protein